MKASFEDVLADARATWKLARERDEAFVEKASTRRLTEATERLEEAAFPSASKRSLRDAIPIALCAISVVVIALLLRHGSMPKESIRPEALLAPPVPTPTILGTASPESAPAESPAAGPELPALPSQKPPSTSREQPRPASTLPQLPPPPAPELRAVRAPKSIKGFFDEDAPAGFVVSPKQRRHPHPKRHETRAPEIGSPPVRPIPPPPRVHKL